MIQIPKRIIIDGHTFIHQRSVTEFHVNSTSIEYSCPELNLSVQFSTTPQTSYSDFSARARTVIENELKERAKQ